MSSPDEMNPFDKARVEWKSLSADRGWFGIFGELYVQRYPFLAGMTAGSAASIKRSLAGDDSVHAFDASGVRQTIISRALETEGRGLIRPWYAHIGFVADATNFIKGITEDEIDFLIRRSHLNADRKSISGLMAKIRTDLIAEIDPPLDSIKTTQGTINQFELEKLASGVIIPASRPTIELFGFLVALTNHLFTISEDEIENVIEILLDPEKTDKFLRRRFIGEETGDYPFVGEQHPRVRTHENMILEVISCGDPEFYRLRIMHLWLYALLRDDRRAQDYFLEKNGAFLQDLQSWLNEDPENRHFSQLIQRAVIYAKFKGIYSRVLLTLRTDYAKQMAYKDYANRLFHLFKRREEVLTALEGLILPVDKDQLELRNILINVGLTAMEADMEKLESQIPVPTGAQEHIQGTIMSRRKANLRKEVLDPVRDDLLGRILEIQDLPQGDKAIAQMAKILRQPHIQLAARGEAYFEEMEERVQEQLAAMGDQTLSGELQYVTDTPQVLVKQYGKEVYRWAVSSGFDIQSLSPGEIYAGMLSLKSTELMFGDATTTMARKHEIAKSLYDDYFSGQALMMKDVIVTYGETIEAHEAAEESELPLSELEDSLIAAPKKKPPPELEKAPKTPEIPEATERSEETETLEIPETPEAAEIPEATERSEETETPEMPETPETPETPEISELSEETETPETPETPEALEKEPKKPEESDRSSSESEKTSTILKEKPRNEEDNH
ncbi:MAG: hypothetical protein ACE5OZ_26010 [Candidatus Heimdallarchaeota archaeon]